MRYSSEISNSILNARLADFMNSNSLFPEQNGFRKGRSCEDHIFSLTSLVKNRLVSNLPTFCAFVDLEKAFDWINRDLLLYRLLCTGIDGNFYQSIKSLLADTKSCILLKDGIKTDWFDVKSGVTKEIHCLQHYSAFS